MYQHLLSNKYISLNISNKGAELTSFSYLNKTILWKKDDRFWNRFAPILFPFVGKLKNDTYTYQDQTFPMKQHGFARDTFFDVTEHAENGLELTLKSDSDSKKVYPFDFELRIQYQLIDKEVFVTTIVHNTGKEVMPFAIGAHPGFHLGASIEAYQLEIPGARMWQRHLIQSGLYTGKTEPIEFDAQGKLDLNDALFAEDAIVFKHQGIKQVRLWEHQKPLLEFTIYGEPAPYWGFWKKPGAPFLCIEPWWGIADSIHSNGRIFDKEGMFRLNEGDSKIFKYGMRILL